MESASKPERNGYCWMIILFSISIFVTFNFMNIRFPMKKPTLALPYHTQDSSGYICPFWAGRLGNLMFQYASLYGISKQKGMRLVISKDDTITQTFLNIPDVIVNDIAKNICSKAIVVSEKQACAFGLQSYNFNRRDTVIHQSYLVSWKYFHYVEDEIRKQFVFKEDIMKRAHLNVEKQIQLYQKKNGYNEHLKTIGVHIRRSDYLTNHNLEYGYNPAPKEYIYSAMDYIRSKFENKTLFLVFISPEAEDIKWRKENIAGIDIINMEPVSAEVDMCSLALCNHSIITGGSYGWWSAWLANGTTVYYRNVASNNSELREEYSKDMDDFFYPGWIGME